MAKIIREERNFKQCSWLIQSVAAAVWAVWLSSLTVGAADLTIQLVGWRRVV